MPRLKLRVRVPFFAFIIMLKLNRKIKRVCATLRNGHMAKKNYVMVKDLSIVVTDFLSFLKRSGLILSFNLEDSFYKIKLNVKAKKLNFFYNEGLRGRKISKDIMPLMPTFNQRMVLVRSNKKGYKIMTIEESFSYKVGGTIMGILIL